MIHLHPTSIAAAALLAGAAGAVQIDGATDVIRIDGRGVMSRAESIAEALVEEDGEPIAVIVRGPAAEIARGSGAGGGIGALGGGVTVDLVSNGLGDEGDIPTGVVFTPDGSAIVIAHRNSRNLTVLDAATRDVLASIDVSGSPNGVAVTPDGTRAVTANIFEDTASIIDLVNGIETAVVPVGDQPGVVRVAPDGLRAVVGNTVSGDLSVVDLATSTEILRIAGVAFSSSTSIAFEHGTSVSTFTAFEFTDPATVVIPERVNARVQFVDIVAGTVTPLNTAANPDALDVSPDGTTIVVNHGSSTRTVSVIDAVSQTVVKTIPTGVDLSSRAIRINPDKTKAMVGVQNAVRVVDLVTNAVSPNISTSGVRGLVRTADGQYCVVVGFSGALVSFASASVVANLNDVVSTDLGAHSPTGPRAALVGNLFTEELLALNTAGAAGFLEERVPSGPPPEGDKARHVGITPDGATAIAVNILGDNVSLIDLAARETDAIVAVGDRPSEVEITPDGTTAVIANLDSTFLTVLDIGAGTTTSVPISRRASHVELSPDGSLAYVAVVADGDGVWRVDTNTLTTIGPKLPTGNMGSIFYNYQQSSGMRLSHDGATLVTCNSADDNVSIIDTASWTEVARVTVGDLPARAEFSPDDATIYVSNRNSDTVSVVSNAGGASTTTGTIFAGDQPFNMAVTPDGARLFIGNYGAKTVSIVDLPGTTVTQTIPLDEPVQDLALDAAGATLSVAGGTWSVSIGPGPVVQLAQSGQFTVIDAASGAILDQLDTGLPPGNLALSEAGALAAFSSPHGDGIAIIAPPSCGGDVDGDGDVDVDDLLILLGAWGPCPGCPADVDGDGDVDVDDLLVVLGSWGAC